MKRVNERGDPPRREASASSSLPLGSSARTAGSSDSSYMSHEKPVLLFDGVCNLCNSVVQFAIKRDRAQRFRFAALQSEAGQALLAQFHIPTESFETFVLVERERYFTKSTAALRVAKGLGHLWPLAYTAIIIPKPLRDLVYDIIAKNRYRWFGKKDQCMVPTPDLSDRFL